MWDREEYLNSQSSSRDYALEAFEDGHPSTIRNGFLIMIYKGVARCEIIPKSKDIKTHDLELSPA